MYLRWDTVTGSLTMTPAIGRPGKDTGGTYSIALFVRTLVTEPGLRSNLTLSIVVSILSPMELLVKKKMLFTLRIHTHVL